MPVLSLAAKQDHLEKVAKTSDLIKALAEFVWNGLDADATEVFVKFINNPLGGVDTITISDNGDGISRERAENDFRNLGDSWKRTAHRTKRLNRAVHGKEGRGRLRFFSLSEKIEWKSTYKDNGDLFDIVIDTTSGNLEKCNVSDAQPSKRTQTGTIVTLYPLKGGFDWLTSNDALIEFTTIFAPYVMQYSDARISYNEKYINPEETILKQYDFPKQSIVGPSRTIKDLSLKVIEWKSHIENRRIHLGGESGIVLGSQPAHVTAPGFEYSAYANSAFFQEMAAAHLLELDNLSDPDFMYVMNHVREQLGEYFRERQAEKSQGIIEDLISVGAYPYSGDPKDELERKERQVFDIATYAVSSYSRDFKQAETSVKKMTLTLLREALRHNPDSLSTILEAVVNLPKTRQDEFSTLLQKTQLGNIISASSLIADRITLLETLRGIVFDPKHKTTIKERGELDIAIRDNTWLFGEHFHLSLPETGLTRVMNRVSESLGTGQKAKKITKLNGKTGRVDHFFGRAIPHRNPNKKEFIVIELKRPSLTITRKELDQLEDYAIALQSQPDFSHTDTTWSFFLVTGDYDELVRTRITQKDRPVGVSLQNENMQVWVKTWSEIIREADGRLQFIQDTLRIEVSDEEIETRIAELKSSILKTSKSKSKYDGTNSMGPDHTDDQNSML